MNEKEYKFKCEIIRKNFKDARKIKCLIPKKDLKIDENIHQGGDIFTTEEGDLIDLEYQLKDFDEKELVKKVELAENLYEKHKKHISIYLLCPKHVKILMKECEIKSEADFTIKLCCINEYSCEYILDFIKNKLKNDTLDENDLHALSMLAIVCKKEDRNYYREEYFKIINQINE